MSQRANTKFHEILTKSRVTQGGSLLKVLRCSQAECSALLFKVRSLLWFYMVVFVFPFMVRYGRICSTLKNRFSESA